MKGLILLVRDEGRNFLEQVYNEGNAIHVSVTWVLVIILASAHFLHKKMFKLCHIFVNDISLDALVAGNCLISKELETSDGYR